jgi:hypothetical protein
MTAPPAFSTAANADLDAPATLIVIFDLKSPLASKRIFRFFLPAKPASRRIF